MKRNGIMGKSIALVLAAMVSLSGCSEQTNSSKATTDETTSNTTSHTTETSGTSSDPATTQTFTFQVNKSMPVYKCTASVSNTEPEQTTQIVITDADTGALVQSIIPPDNEEFMKSAVSFMDVTFSGNLALIIPLERSAHYVSFDAYLWDAEKKQFIEAPSFQTIWNPSIDAAGKRILAEYSGDQITSYSMISFNDNQFVLTNSIYWEPAGLESTPVSNAENLAHFVETKGTDSKNVVNQFYAPSNEPYDIDKNDPHVKPYFASGSFWDLNSQKWNCTFYDDAKQF